MASLGAANGVGLVVGPALAAAPARQDLGLPLCVTAALPLPAIGILWRLLPRNERISDAASGAPGLGDARLRRPMIVAFAAMFSVAIGQITVGFFAIDRLQLEPEQAAQAAWLRRMPRPSVNPIRLGDAWGVFALRAPGAHGASKPKAQRVSLPLCAWLSNRAVRFWGEAAARRKKKSACSADSFFPFRGGAAQAGRPIEVCPKRAVPRRPGAVISKRR